MKGSKWILFLAAVLILTAGLLRADEYAMPLDKTVGPGLTNVKYDGIIYHIISDADYTIKLEEVGSKYVRLTARLIKEEVQQFHEISIQWNSSPINNLTIGSPGENSYLLNTETGYAEK